MQNTIDSSTATLTLESELERCPTCGNSAAAPEPVKAERTKRRGKYSTGDDGVDRQLLEEWVAHDGKRAYVPLEEHGKYAAQQGWWQSGWFCDAVTADRMERKYA